MLPPLLLLLAFALRAYHLDFQSLWSDEGISLLRSGQPLGQMLRLMPVEHVPGYFVLLHFWLPLAGTSDFSLRFASLIPSVLTVALTFRLGRDLGSSRAGLAAALLLATGAFQVWYGQEARMYSWLLCTALAATWFLWRMLRAGEASDSHPPIRRGRRDVLARPGPPGHEVARLGELTSSGPFRLRQVPNEASLPVRHPSPASSVQQGSATTSAGRERQEPAGRGVWRDRSLLAAFAGYVLCTAASIYLHHYGFLLPIAHTVFMAGRLAVRHDLRGFLRWTGAGAAVLVLYLPWAPRFLGIFAFPGWREPIDPSGLPWRYLTAYTAGDAMPEPWHAWLPWLYLALALAGTWVWWRRRRVSALLLLSVAVIPLAGAFALALRRPDFHERYTIFASAPLLLLAAGGLEALDFRAWRRNDAPGANFGTPLAGVAPGLLLAGLVGLNCLATYRVYADPAVQKADYKTPLHIIQETEQSGDVILLDGPEPAQIFQHYYRGPTPWYDLRPLLTAGPADVEAQMRSVTAPHERAWVLRHYHDAGPVETWLSQNAWPVNQAYYGGLYFSAYLLNGTSRGVAAGQEFGPGLRLQQAALVGSQTLRSGGLLGVTTTWQERQKLPALKFSLRLQDEQGRRWAAEDYVPGGGLAPTEGWQPGQTVTDRHALQIPYDLPPGSYRVALVLYDPANGQPYAAGDAVALATVEIAGAPAPAGDLLPIPNRLADSPTMTQDLRLLGYGLTPHPLQAGQASELALWWQKTAARLPAEPAQVLVELRSAGDDLAARKLYPLSATPEDRWPTGQVARGRYALELNPAAPGGTYDLNLTLVTPDGRPLGPTRRAGSVAFETRTRVYRLPVVAHPLNMRLGDAITLRGYDLAEPPASTAPGALRLTLYWQATAAVSAHYKVFVHLTDANGQVVAQSDALPAGGEAPTESWLANEVIVDRHTLQAPAAGRYQLVAGLYDPDSGQRPAVAGQDGRALPDNAVPLAGVEVK